MQSRHTNFQPSGQNKFHISLCFTVVSVKLFLTTGFDIDIPYLQITLAPYLDHINNWFALTGFQKYCDTIFLQLIVKHSIMRFAFKFVVATCLIHIHEGAIVTSINEGITGKDTFLCTE